jgi:hypothetical protein
MRYGRLTMSVRMAFAGALLGLVGFPVSNVLAQGLTFSNVADTTTIAPGQGSFIVFGNPSISGSNVVFQGGYKVGTGTGSGIYAGSVGTMGAAKIVDQTDTAPGQGTFVGFGNPSVSGSNVAFMGGTAGGSGTYTGSVGTTGAVKIVDQTDIAPGHGVFISFSNVTSVSGSNVAFRGGYSGGGSGIYTGSVGATGAAKVVDTSDTAPGHGAFSSLGIPSVSGSNVAFSGSYSGGSGIYTGSVGATGAIKIVDTGDTAPGHGVFTSFGNLSLSGSNVGFIGNFSGGSGIYMGTMGTTGSAKQPRRSSRHPMAWSSA